VKRRGKCQGKSWPHLNNNPPGEIRSFTEKYGEKFEKWAPIIDAVSIDNQGESLIAWDGASFIRTGVHATQRFNPSQSTL